jgi:glutathione S-transferase
VVSGCFVLHGSPHSLPTYRVALMPRLSGAGFTFRYVSFQRGIHLTAEFRVLSRWGQVPVLEQDGRVFLQSAAILEYLAETLGRFAAGDAEARQHVREWLFWNADRLTPPLCSRYGIEPGRRGLLPLSFDPVLVVEFDRKGRAALGVLDEALAGIWCYADIAFARLSGRDLAEWRQVTAWAERIEALPGFAPPFDLLAMQDAEIAP